MSDETKNTIFPPLLAAALKEAKSRWPREAVGGSAVPLNWLDEGMASGFVLGAEWQDRQAVEITDAMIERAARALFASEEPDRNTWRWDKKNPMTPDDPHGWHEYWLDAAQVALEAALNGGKS